MNSRASSSVRFTASAARITRGSSSIASWYGLRVCSLTMTLKPPHITITASPALADGAREVPEGADGRALGGAGGRGARHEVQRGAAEAERPVAEGTHRLEQSPTNRRHHGVEDLRRPLARVERAEQVGQAWGRRGLNRLQRGGSGWQWDGRARGLSRDWARLRRGRRGRRRSHRGDSGRAAVDERHERIRRVLRARGHKQREPARQGGCTTDQQASHHQPLAPPPSALRSRARRQRCGASVRSGGHAQVQFWSFRRSKRSKIGPESVQTRRRAGKRPHGQLCRADQAGGRDLLQYHSAA